MAAIDQLKSANQITQALVRQAMAEAKADPKQMSALQEVIDAKQATDFVDPTVQQHVQQFLLDYNCDKLDFKPNTTNAKPRPPIIEEARITKVVTTQVNMNPPAPVGRYRDPLHVTGRAEAGSKVEFYNASRPGRPQIDEVAVNPDGSFRFECTDETKFSFGDQIGCRVVDGHGDKSRAVIVKTDPYQVNQQVNAANPSQVVRITHQAMPRNHDVELPFYQEAKVDRDTRSPANLGEPWTLTLTGKDDAVEPNSTLSVVVNGETFRTTADDNGMFSLKVRGFTPGQRLTLNVRDVNDHGFDIPLPTDPVPMDMAVIGGGISAAPTLAPPPGMPAFGATGPYAVFDANGVTPPNGALVLRNRTTGDVVELPGDEKGNVRAAIGGLTELDVLEIATRDVNGIMTPKTEWAVLLPEKLRGQKGLLTPVSALDKQSTADVKGVIESIKGPPVDVIRNGQPDPRGPFLRMPDTSGLPPFGQLAVLRDGEVIQTLRADKDGCLQGVLAGVHVGDQLNFRVLDAAGRRFPGELIGWTVPDNKKTSTVAGERWTSDDRTLHDCFGKVGTGDLTIEHHWVQPFTVLASGSGPISANVRLHYPLETFGGPRRQQETADQISMLPQAIAQKFQLASHETYQLQIVEENGTQAIKVNRMQVDQHRNLIPSQMAEFGIDVVIGQINLGDPNQRIDLTNPNNLTHPLQQILTVLRTSLAFVATAHDQGKEPGDVGYDKPMQMVKTCLYALDRLAVENPAHKDAIKGALTQMWPTDFPFEQVSRLRVPPKAADGSAPVQGSRSSTLSLLDAVTAMKSGADVGTDGTNAPRVESAIILMAQNGREENPLRVRGRAKPGEIVQIFNYSTAGRALLAQTAADKNGRFEIVTNAADLQLGDKLGISSLTKDGKSSKVRLVPTDGYLHHGDPSQAIPVARNDRSPFVQSDRLTVENASFDATGQLLPGGPKWKVSGADFAVEPLAKVKVDSKTPDGRPFTVETRADAEGKFEVEFPSMGHADFKLTVYEDGGGAKPTTVPMRTGSLTKGSKVTGESIGELASGLVTFHLPTGDVRGILVDSSYRQGNRAEVDIPEAERTDNFVDVVLQLKYRATYTSGTRDEDYTVRVKIPADEAKKFTPKLNEHVRLSSAALDTLAVEKSENAEILERRFLGDALIRNRDYLLELPATPTKPSQDN